MAANPKVTSFYDALVYAPTNLSVGHSDIFAKVSPEARALIEEYTAVREPLLRDD